MTTIITTTTTTEATTSTAKMTTRAIEATTTATAVATATTTTKKGEIVCNEISVHLNKEWALTENTKMEDLLNLATAPHEGVQVDDLPPHCTYYNYAFENGRFIEFGHCPS